MANGRDPLLDWLGLDQDRQFGVEGGDRGLAVNQFLPVSTNRPGSASWVTGGSSPRLAVPEVIGRWGKGLGDLYRGEVSTPEAVGTLMGPLSIGTAQTGAVLGSGARRMPLSFEKMSQVVGAVKSAQEPIFARWSRGPEYDLKPGARSRNQITGEMEAGLSANQLSPDDDYIRLARLIREYQFTQHGGQDIKPHLYEGKILGKGGDTEPVISPTKHVGSFSDDLLNSMTDASKIERLELQRSIANSERRGVDTLGYLERNYLENQRERLARLGGPLTNDPLLRSVALPVPVGFNVQSQAPSQVGFNIPINAGRSRREMEY